ncbi:MAG: gfo/Idh/MocA family oxidoreductase [Candidatus Omnitrophota bacterium]|jgi:predicted dehydrogenase|nr:MAG: gfo/Idh/MocA family oxidoreductase [Candidatus Omnitrophota bacterium]
MSQNKLSRRIFLMGAAAAMGGCAAVRKKPSLSKLDYKSPNEKLNIAAIGCGGKGSSDIDGAAAMGDNVYALCDPDWAKAGSKFEQYPAAKRYKDYRELLEKEGKNLDAVTISTPDHNHAPACMLAIRQGIHVYVQKPMVHTVYEAHALLQAAREYGVATQMGNQGHSGDGIRKMCEIIWSDAIGPVREVHAWTNRPIWPQGIADPLPEEEIPETMEWDTWLGPAPYRPYNSGYAPFNWRGWYDYGTGALGDMACHILDAPNWALKLTAPTSVECIEQDTYSQQTYPNKSIIRFEFPARGTMPPVTLTWYDGGLMPPRPEGLEERDRIGDRDQRNGSLFIGDSGIATTGTYADGSRLLPGSKMEEFKAPRQMIPRSIGHYEEWLMACKGGLQSPGSFEYAAPFTSWILLGVIALRVPGKLYWDEEKFEFTNSKEATDLLHIHYRKGWTL